ncbi:dTMP kinase [Nitrososphaera sp.]|uniref:dTMP kinase n=1 Tax=Nitrososphaera sp. TaxID=1971748 RepID=UPI0018290C43|nr:dTMP kinase [Nitrososphaera sp.]NWG36690.1 dTMP kinase [Nitrososphaera sp.]
MTEQKQNISRFGIFLVFEGPHASGKSYFAKRLINQMSSTNLQFVYTKEPYDSKLKPIIRELSTKRSNDPFVLFYLIAADRVLHLRKVEDLLSSGVNVISDRYIHSTEVYQRMQGIPLKLIHHVNSLTRQPDLLFYVNTPFAVRKKRILNRNKKSKDLFYQDAYLTLENDYYLQIKRRLMRKPYVTIVDGQSKDDIYKIKKVIMKKLSQKSL